MIKCCGDLQCNGIDFRSDPFIESLPLMLQTALLLACVLCQHMLSTGSINTSIPITLTAFGVLFYVAIVIVRATLARA